MIVSTDPIAYLPGLANYLADFPPEFAAALLTASRQRLLDKPHGDMVRWQRALMSLPPVAATLLADRDCISLVSDHAVDIDAVKAALMPLSPWRKGPFNIFGVEVDTEWRSDWKWQRLQPHIRSLTGRRVLDVGCGSGYHMWRMWGEGAASVLGLDPTMLYWHQYQVLKRYLPLAPVWFAPLRLEQTLGGEGSFDTVFSMGVLYHQKSPLDHLERLRALLRSGGELVLETLVVEGNETTLLMPEDRYAAMRNVWFLPSVPMLMRWLTRLGFLRVRVVDVVVTSTAEQRRTEWMTFQSLADFLDAGNQQLTREGYPSPRRAIVLAETP